MTAMHIVGVGATSSTPPGLKGLHGHAVRLGERSGVPTPMRFTVSAALELSLLGPPGGGGRRG